MLGFPAPVLRRGKGCSWSMNISLSIGRHSELGLLSEKGSRNRAEEGAHIRSYLSAAIFSSASDWKERFLTRAKSGGRIFNRVGAGRWLGGGGQAGGRR